MHGDHHEIPAEFEALIEQRMGEMFEEANKIQEQVESAQKAGKDVTAVMGPPGVKVGDIIDLMRYNDEHPEGDPETKRKARVIHAAPMNLLNKDTKEIWEATEVLCVLLDDGDVTTEEEFKAMYGEGEADDEVQDTSEISSEEVPVESVPSVSTPVEVTVAPVRDPNVCECGADREMCMRNQDLIGMHINES